MSFWNEDKRKARKEHKCYYCGKIIKKDELYYRETGVYDNEFYDYCLCERCRWIIDKYEEPGEDLSDFLEVIFNNDFLCCPKCGSINMREHEFSQDKMSCECECDNCGNTWVEDLSLEALKNKDGN